MVNNPIQILFNLIGHHNQWDELILLGRHQFLTMEGQTDDRLYFIRHYEHHLL